MQVRGRQSFKKGRQQFKTLSSQSWMEGQRAEEQERQTNVEKEIHDSRRKGWREERRGTRKTEMTQEEIEQERETDITKLSFTSLKYHPYPDDGHCKMVEAFVLNFYEQ